MSKTINQSGGGDGQGVAPLRPSEEELHEMAVKAMVATNLCMKHMKYHGQKTKDCTPQERVMIRLKQGLAGNRDE